jgi:flagellin
MAVIYAIAQRMRAQVAGYGVVQQSLDRGEATLDVALAAGEAISDLLIEMKEKALGAADASLDTASRTALNEDFKALRDQINTIVNNAEFNGLNLIDGSTASFVALANQDGSNTITVTSENMSLSGTIVTVTRHRVFRDRHSGGQYRVADRNVFGQCERGAGAPGDQVQVAGDPLHLRHQTV